MPRIRAENIEAHKELQRREILEATHSLLAEAGTAEIPLGDVAARVGIGRTTLYEYFRDKDDLIASLVEETLPSVIADLIAGIPQGFDTEERLRRLVRATVEFVVADPVLGLILHRELPRLSAEAQERIRVAHADLSREMSSLYMAGVTEGRFRAMAPDVAGRFIHETIMAAARIIIDAPDPESRLAEVLDATEAFLMGGLSAP